MENVKKTNEVKEIEVIYNATFINKSWRVGTKTDKNKEYGVISFNIEVPFAEPKEDGSTSYVQTIDVFVFDKKDFPQEHIDRYSEIKVVYTPPVLNPQGKMRFKKIIV